VIKIDNHLECQLGGINWLALPCM